MTDAKQPVPLESRSGSDTLFYLGYGSNMGATSFRQRRGIKPLKQVNVVVPELMLTFDLPAIPYLEPCFANVRYREKVIDFTTEKTALIANSYHPQKTRWTKGLVGVVYEVTKEDYATIIRTEGGGSSYQDVLVDCYPLSSTDNTVPVDPLSKPFLAHTLYAPPLDDDGGRVVRPNPDYAQASVRYMKLLTDGSEELKLPQEYREYLRNIGAYRITQARQRLGLFVFMIVWGPVIAAVFALRAMFSGRNGRSPQWLNSLGAMIFRAIWITYDAFFKPLFGDGERTVEPKAWKGDEEQALCGGRTDRR